ncbi:MAG: diaminopropionate ammonia-lyase [Acidisphaera sp.]|nr:diaminopropionate ammonia-lyase [Acidisphaera sp.]
MSETLWLNHPGFARSNYPFAELLSLAHAGAARDALVACPAYAVTPMRDLPDVAARAGVARVLYKDEGGRFGLGSFKGLGGAYAVARLLAAHVRAATGEPASPADLVGGRWRALTADVTVACATDGNHGRSVAAGARRFGARCRIFLHAEVSQGREDAIAAFGADIVRVPGTYDDAVRAAALAAKREGLHLVSDTSWPGYEDVPADVMRGYGVMMLEAGEQLEVPPTHAFIQGGVGGLAAAVCAHLWEAHGPSGAIVVVVEPERADCLFQSALAGAPRPSSGDLRTIMSGLACGEVSWLAWRVLAAGAHGFMRIADIAAIEGMRTLARPGRGRPGIVAGDSATAGLAGLLIAAADAAMRAALRLDETSRVLLIGSEGATDPLLYAELVAGA